MNIGILGAGNVGQSFAKAVLALGHNVMLSSRQPESAEMQALAASLGAQVGTVEQTLAFGGLIAVALRWDAVADVAKQGDWTGKTVIDMTNRFGGASGLSGAQEFQQLVPSAHIVKGFNTIGAEHYPQPIIGGQAASMFIAGDHADSKRIVADLTRQMGFDVVDVGDLAASRHIESLAALWVHLAGRAGYGRDIAFKLVR